MKRKFIIGSRGSQLALWQTEYVKTQLENRFPDTKFTTRIIKTTGDAILDTALSKIGDKGLFTRQIETALLNNEIDLAVHSLKDLPTTRPEGLVIAAVSSRETANDVLISKNFSSISDLPQNAKLATGSLRRRSQLLAFRPDLEIIEIRGNVPTRIEKFLASDLDGLILAYAGIHRLQLDSYITQIIPTEILLPAVGQGVMGIDARAGDFEMLEMLDSINDKSTQKCVSAERAFLRMLEGGCQVPIGGFATIDGEEIHLQGFVGSRDGSNVIRDSIRGEINEAEILGRRLAENFIKGGASEMLKAAPFIFAKIRERGCLMSSILVVREFDDFSRVLQENAFETINCPTIKTVPLEDLSEFENALNGLKNYDGIFLTSAAAAEIFRRKLNEKRTDYSGRVYVLGEKSYKVLRNEKLDLVFDKSYNRAIEMLEAIPLETIENKRFLFIRGDKSLRVIPEYLSKLAAVDEMIVYRTVNITIADEKRSEIAGKFSRNEINCVCFFSPSGAESFIEQFGSEILKRTKIAVIGKTTADYFERQNLSVWFISKNSSANDYAFELVQYFKN